MLIICHTSKDICYQFNKAIFILANKMGCVNSHQKPKQAVNRDKVYQQQQPSILHGDGTMVLPPLEVTSYACGYSFTNPQDLGCSMHTKSEVTAQSRGAGLADQLRTLTEKCRIFYENHDIDRANDQLVKIQEIIAKNDINGSPMVTHILESNRKVMETVREQYDDVIMYENQILKGGWVQKSNRKGVKVSTRRQQDTVGVLVQSIVDQPFQILISFCIEMDLYKQFMPFIKVSRQQKIAARNCRIGYTQNNIPIFSIREAFFQGIGYNRLHKNNTLFLFTRSIHIRPDLQQKLGYKCHTNDQYVQLQYKYFVLWYEPLSRGRGKITLAMNVDIKLNFIPLWIQDKLSQDFGEQFFENIMKLSKKFKNSQWQKNTSANPQLFSFFKNAIDERLAQMENQDKSQKVTNYDSGHMTTSRSGMV